MNISTGRFSRAMFIGAILCGLFTVIMARSLTAGAASSGVAFTGDKPKKEEKKKFEPPKMPAGYPNPTWDVSALEERFIFLKTSVDLKNSAKYVVFLVELKEDVGVFSGCYLWYIDNDGVKTKGQALGLEPFNVKKGDRARLVLGPLGFKSDWAGAVKVKFVFN